MQLNASVVDMSVTADDLGYRLVASDAGTFCSGTTQYPRSMAEMHLNQPVVGTTSTG
jgi:hypothetical protein